MQLNPRVHVQTIGNETALVQFETGLFYGLNEVGQHIFKLLKNGADCEQIVGDLTETFSVDETQARSDYNTFIDDLLREKILEP